MHALKIIGNFTRYGEETVELIDMTENKIISSNSKSVIQKEKIVSDDNTVSAVSKNTEMDIQETQLEKEKLSLAENNENDPIAVKMDISETISEAPILIVGNAEIQNNGNEKITVVEVDNIVMTENNETLPTDKKEEKDMKEEENIEIIKKKRETENFPNKIILSPQLTLRVDNDKHKNEKVNVVVLVDKTKEISNSNTTVEKTTTTSFSPVKKNQFISTGHKTDLKKNEIEPISVKMEIVDESIIKNTEKEKIIVDENLVKKSIETMIVKTEKQNDNGNESGSKDENKDEKINENENKSEHNKIVLPQKIHSKEENEELNEIESSGVIHDSITINNDDNDNNSSKNDDNKTVLPLYSLQLPNSLKQSISENNKSESENENENSADEKAEMKMKNKSDSLLLTSKNATSLSTSTSTSSSSVTGYRTPR